MENNCLFISKHIEIEVVGIFELGNNFNLSNFSSKDYSAIYSNIKPNENDFGFAIIEEKLDSNKISKLLN